MSPPGKPRWQQATALVSLGAGGAVTGLSFVPATVTDPAAPPITQIRLLALHQAAQAQPGQTNDETLRSAIVNVARYYLRLAASKTPAEMEALIWQHDTPDGADHGPSCAAFSSLTLELAAQVAGQRSWISGGSSYPWPLAEWADVRVDPNPDSLQIVSVLQDAQSHHRWHPLGDGYQPQPGDWVMFDGHIEVITSYARGVLDTIGGDSLPNFTVNAHQFSGPLADHGITGFVDNGHLPSAPGHRPNDAGGPAAAGGATGAGRAAGAGRSRGARGAAGSGDTADASATGAAGTTAMPGHAALPGDAAVPGTAAFSARPGHAARPRHPGAAVIPGIATPAAAAPGSPGHQPGRTAAAAPAKPGAGRAGTSGSAGTAGSAGAGDSAIPGLPTAPAGSAPAEAVPGVRGAFRATSGTAGVSGAGARGATGRASGTSGTSGNGGNGPTGRAGTGGGNHGTGTASGGGGTGAAGADDGTGTAGGNRGTGTAGAGAGAGTGTGTGTPRGTGTGAGSPGYGRHEPVQPPTAGTADQRAFIEAIVPGAIAAQQRYGVPAAVTIAQAIDESAWGQSTLASRDHNLFGIKGIGPAGSDRLPTREFAQGRYVTVTGSFRVYRSDAESIDDHGRLLATSGYYQHAMSNRGNPNAFAAALTGVYATDPHYGAKIISIMSEYGLYQYGSAATAPTAPAPAPAPPDAPSRPRGSQASSPGADVPGVPAATPSAAPAPGTSPAHTPGTLPAPGAPRTPGAVHTPGAAHTPGTVHTSRTPSRPHIPAAPSPARSPGAAPASAPATTADGAAVPAAAPVPDAARVPGAAVPVPGLPVAPPMSTAPPAGTAPSHTPTSTPARTPTPTPGRTPAGTLPGGSTPDAAPRGATPARPSAARRRAPAPDSWSAHGTPARSGPVPDITLDAYHGRAPVPGRAVPPVRPASRVQASGTLPPRVPRPATHTSAADVRAPRRPAAGAASRPARYRHQLPASVTTAFLTRAQLPLLREEPLYRDVASVTGLRWELLAACDWMQCRARPRYSPVHGERLGSVNSDGTVYRTRSEALEQCAEDLAELAWAVYRVDVCAGAALPVRDLANVFAAFRWGGLLKLHRTSAMEFPYSVAGLTPHHLNMRWPNIDEPNTPDRPGARFRMPFGALPVVLSLDYPALA